MNSWALAMDNILVSQEVYPVSIATPVGVDGFTDDAARAALAALTLTAVDTKGNTKHTFDNLAENWVLDLVSHKATYTVADSLLPMGYFFADSTATIIVNLIDKHTVTATAGENGTVAGAGTYNYNTEVTLTATADKHYHFVKWSNGATDATYTFTLTGDTTLTAEFAIDQHTVTIGEAVNGSVTGTTSGTYDYGKVVTLIANPEVGYHFVQWSDGTKDATYIFTLTGDTTLTAEFAINQHTVTIGEAENGSVKVAVNGKDTTATTFDYGTVLTLTPMANVSYSFEKWDDGNTDNPRVITLTENISITAIFKKDAPTQLVEATTETKVQKVMRNGQVFIIRNGNTYDLTGRKTE